MEPLSDETLLKQFADGRRAALGEIAQRYEASLLGLAQGLLRGRDDLARVAVQETWVRVIRFVHTFNGDAGVKTWLYRIAINQCRDLTSLAAKHASKADADSASRRKSSSCWNRGRTPRWRRSSSCASRSAKSAPASNR